MLEEARARLAEIDEEVAACRREHVAEEAKTVRADADMGYACSSGQPQKVRWASLVQEAMADGTLAGLLSGLGQCAGGAAAMRAAAADLAEDIDSANDRSKRLRYCSTLAISAA